MAQQWQALRIQNGHFDGGPWNDAVDRWQGSKHLLMQQLARQAMQERWSTDQLTTWMGPPDQTVRAEDPDHAWVLAHTQWQGVPAGEWRLYRWRGTHDQLVIALQAGQVTATGWLFALE